jgi:hypothetical protein
VSLAVVGVAFVVLYLVGLFTLMDRTTWDTWGAAIIGPVLFLVTLPALARQARREGNPKVLWILVAALAAKMVFSLFRYYHAFYVVGKADAIAYDQVGTEIAHRFLDGNYDPGLERLLDTNWIRLFTGIVYTLIRPSVVSGFLIYAWLAFWGTYFFYRAFVLALPDADRSSYARWLFFLPSVLFWSSSIGKESWMMFGLGIAAFGTAKALSGRVVPGLLVSGIGIGLAALVRAPTAVAMGIGLVVGGILRRPSHRLAEFRPIAKIVSLAMFVGVAVVLSGTLQGYIDRQGRGDLEDLTEFALQQTSQGGSEFSPVPFFSPFGVPIAVGTVLFRPFLFEAHTVEAVGSALEASALLLLTVIRWRSLLEAARSLRRSPYVAAAVVFVAGTIFGLSAVANFGIIARQRTLIYPMFLVLLCLSTRRTAAKGDRRSATGTASLPSVAVGARP